MSRSRHPRQTPLATGFGFGPPRERGERPVARPDASTSIDDALTIGEVALRFGVTLRTLRFYETRGLLAPARQGQARLYDAAQLASLARLLSYRRLGFTLHEIEGLLVPNSGPALTPARIAAQIAHLEEQRRLIDAAIAELRAMLDVSN